MVISKQEQRFAGYQGDLQLDHQLSGAQKDCCIIPIVPTVFDESFHIDHPGQLRAIDCTIDQGVNAICILANFSEQFSLSDEERASLTIRALEHVGGRCPVVVTISHFSTDIASQRAKFAKDAGASMLMMMPPYHGAGVRLSESAIYEHFTRVADAAELPIIIQDAPLSGVPLSASLLENLARSHQMLRHSKIEVAQSADKIAELSEKARDVLTPFDGEEGITLMADLDAGAQGTMCSAMAADLVGDVCRANAAGNRKKAIELYRQLLPLLNYENRQCGLRAAKAVMKFGKVIKSDAVRHPLAPLSERSRKGLLELAEASNPLAARWGR